MRCCARIIALWQRRAAGERSPSGVCWAVFLFVLVLLGCPGRQAVAWQVAGPEFSSAGAALRSAGVLPEMPVRLPPVGPPPPLLAMAARSSPQMVAAPVHVWTPHDYARRIATEPAPVDLPQPLFIASLPAATEVLPEGMAVGPSLGPDLPNLAEEGLSEEVLPDAAGRGRERRGFFARCFGPGIEEGGEMLSDIRFDYRNFYSGRSLLWLGAGIGVAAALANTPADQHVQNWYQDDVRNGTTDHLRDDFSWFGNGGYMLPVFLGTAFVFTPFEDYSPVANGIGTYGRRSTRAFLVGGPMLLALQYGLGAHRPSAYLDSHWHPFKDSHGASGDAWIGAITFMTAAKMVDSRLLKVGFYSLALLPAYGRLNVNQHYLSQVLLGVWLGYLSVEAVDITERSKQVYVVPFVNSAGSGLGFEYKW